MSSSRASNSVFVSFSPSLCCPFPVLTSLVGSASQGHLTLSLLATYSNTFLTTLLKPFGLTLISQVLVTCFSLLAGPRHHRAQEGGRKLGALSSTRGEDAGLPGALADHPCLWSMLSPPDSTLHPPPLSSLHPFTSFLMSSFFAALLMCNLHYCKVHPFQIHNSLILSNFITLCYHKIHSSLFAVAPGKIQNLPFLDISYNEIM